MPYANKILKSIQRRNEKRTIRHGNWRQIIYDYNFMCAKCGTYSISDLHEPFGEIKYNNGNGNGKMQARIPLCYNCHSLEHDNNIIINRNHVSQYLKDIEREIKECGNMNNWCKKYNIREVKNERFMFN